MKEDNILLYNTYIPGPVALMVFAIHTILHYL